MSRTYVISGSASGIGRSAARILRERGETVIGIDLHDADVSADLSSPTGRHAAAARAVDLAGGRVDAIIANAGLATPTPATVAVNYFGAVDLIDALLPALEGSPTPRVAVTSSMASLMPVDNALVDDCLADEEAEAMERAAALAGDPMTGGLIYSSSKRALSRWVRRESITERFAGRGIPLNAAAPGIVLTPMVADLLATPESTAAVDAMVPMPLGGHMEADVVAKLLIWLTSEDNSHLCGQTIYIDGGSDVALRGEDVWSWHQLVPAG